MVESLTASELHLSPTERILRFIQNEDASILQTGESPLILDPIGIPTIGIGVALIISSSGTIRRELGEVFSESGIPLTTELADYLQTAVEDFNAGLTVQSPPDFVITREQAESLFLNVFRRGPEDDGVEGIIRNLFINRTLPENEDQLSEEEVAAARLQIYQDLGGNISLDRSDTNLSDDSIRLEVIRDIGFRGVGQLTDDDSINEDIHGDLHDQDLIEITIAYQRALENHNFEGQVAALNAGFDRILTQILPDNNSSNAGGVDVRYFRGALEYYFGTHLPSDAFATTNIANIAQLPPIGIENQFLTYQLLTHIRGTPGLEGRLETILDSSQFDGTALVDTLLTNIRSSLDETGIVGTKKDDVLIDGIQDDEGNIIEEFEVNELDGGAGNDIIFGGLGNDEITGGTGDDVLNGGQNDDILAGGRGDDILIGGSGFDQFSGGIGFDTISYASDVGGIRFSLGGNDFPTVTQTDPDTGAIFSFATEAQDGFTTFDSYNRFDIEAVIGSEFNDEFIIDRADFFALEQINGGGGNDRLLSDTFIGDEQYVLDLNGEDDTSGRVIAEASRLGQFNDEIVFTGIEDTSEFNDLAVIADFDSSDRVDLYSGQVRYDNFDGDITFNFSDDSFTTVLDNGTTHQIAEFSTVYGSTNSQNVFNNTGGSITYVGGAGDDIVNIFEGASSSSVYVYTGGQDRVNAINAFTVGPGGQDVALINTLDFTNVNFSISNLGGMPFVNGVPGFETFDLQIDFEETGDSLFIESVVVDLPGGAGSFATFIPIVDANTLEDTGARIELTFNPNNRAFLSGEVEPLQTLTGTFGDDLLRAVEGEDQILNGALGDDRFVDSAGSQTYRGGLDLDVLDYTSTNDNVTVTFDFLPGEGSISNGADIDVFSGVEEIRTGSGDDIFDGPFVNDVNLVLNGGFGNDTYTFEETVQYTISDSGDNDTLLVQPGLVLPSLNFVRNGDDLAVFTGSLSNAVVIENHFGSGAIETLEFQNGFPFSVDLVALTADLEDTGPEPEPNVIEGTAVSETLIGTDQADFIAGFAGDDILNGGAGDDTLVGGAGDDVYIFAPGGGDDRIIDTEGFNILRVEGDLDPQNFVFTQIGNDLQIEIASGVTIVDFFVEENTVQFIENSVGERFEINDLIAASDNQTPIAVDDSFDAAGEDTFVGNVLDNDSDPDGDTLTAIPQSITTATGATVELLANGDFTYTAAEDFVGMDSFEYTVTDAFGLSDTASVTLNNIDAVVEADIAPEIIGGGDVEGVIEVVETPFDFVPEPQEFPELVERARLGPAEVINGANRQNLSFDTDRTIDINFVEEGAGFRNTLGIYEVAEDGTLTNVRILAENLSGTGPGVFGGGDFNSGDLIDSINVQAGTEIGFFIIANGFNRNRGFRRFDLEEGELNFVNRRTGDLADIDDLGRQIRLEFTDADGDVSRIRGQVFHASSTSLNRDGETHAVSGENEAGNLVIGFEDLTNLGDADFNDVVIELSVSPTTELLLEPVLLAENVLLADDDDMTLTELAVELTTGEQTGDLLTIDESLLAGTNIDLIQTSDTSFVLVGAENVLVYQDILQTLEFNNLSEVPEDGDRTFNITVTDLDGLTGSTEVVVEVNLDANQDLDFIDRDNVLSGDDPLSGALADFGASREDTDTGPTNTTPFEQPQQHAHVETRIDNLDDLTQPATGEFG